MVTKAVVTEQRELIVAPIEVRPAGYCKSVPFVRADGNPVVIHKQLQSDIFASSTAEMPCVELYISECKDVAQMLQGPRS